MNKYIKSNTQNEESYENIENEDLISTDKLSGLQLIFNFEDTNYFINSKNYGKYLGNLTKQEIRDYQEEQKGRQE